ncbi:hypothetical protein B0H14DRAFT_2629246 [Mycena olivaceomarginata]|nr:hypothetical protein B0H14DRAFT_2629246 [Mycena olivaceomarginata]
MLHAARDTLAWTTTGFGVGVGGEGAPEVLARIPGGRESTKRAPTKSSRWPPHPDGRGNTQLALSSTFPLPSRGHQQFKLGIECRNISGDLDPQSFPTHTNCANRNPGEGVKEEF